MKITKTDLVLYAKCKCGAIPVATVIWGGIEIDGETLETMAEIYNDGGSIEVGTTAVKLSSCKCKEGTTDTVECADCGNKHIIAKRVKKQGDIYRASHCPECDSESYYTL